jgi:hypothetical protein
VLSWSPIAALEAQTTICTLEKPVGVLCGLFKRTQIFQFFPGVRAAIHTTLDRSGRDWNVRHILTANPNSLITESGKKCNQLLTISPYKNLGIRG